MSWMAVFGTRPIVSENWNTRERIVAVVVLRSVVMWNRLVYEYTWFDCKRIDLSYSR